MPVYYVYVLETVAKNGRKTFYTGYTKDLYRRLSEHKNGNGSKYCRGKKKIELKYFETYTQRKRAINREFEIKKYSRQEKNQLILNFNSK